MNILERLVKATTGHPILTILIVLGITGIALIPASNFAVDSSFEVFLSSDDPDVLMSEEVKEEFGSQDLVTVVIDSSNSDAPAAEAYVESLADKLRRDDRWKDIQYREDLSFVGEKGILYLPEDYLVMLTAPDITPQMVDAFRESMVEEISVPKYIVSDDGKLYLINMGVSIAMEDAEVRESLFDDLGVLIKETREEDETYSNLDVGFTGGLMVIDYESDKMLTRDFYRTAGITFVLIFALLFVSFRSLWIPVLAVIPLLLGIVWTSGIMFLVYDSLNLWSIMFAALILGVGIDYCIHLLTRFMDEMEEHEDVETAFNHTFVHTGKAVVIGCVTTAVALFSFYFAEAKGLHQLGVVGAVGLLLTLAAIFVLLPALVTLRLRFGRFGRGRARYKILGVTGFQVQRFAVIVVILLVALLVTFSIRASNARLSENIYELMPTEIETYKQLEKVKENFGYNPDYLTSVVESEAELTRSVEEFQGMDEVLKVESILDYLPQNQTGKLDIVEQAIEVHPEFAAVPWINVSPMSYDELPTGIRQAWVSDGEFLIKITPVGDIYERSYQRSLLSDLREVHPNITGEAVTWTKVLDMIAADMIRTSLLVSGLLLLIVYIGIRQRNPVYALLSLVPVVFGVVGLLGTYQWFGANLNVFSIAMIPLIIGIGIDDGVHIIHRYLEEGKGSLPRVTQLTGKAIFLTTATTCLAFSSFLFSGLPTLRFLSLIPIIGLSLCLFGAIIFLPALLRVIVDRPGTGRNQLQRTRERT